MDLTARLDQLLNERLAAVARDHKRSVERAIVRCFDELRTRDDLIGQTFAAHAPTAENLTRLADELKTHGIRIAFHPRYTGGRLVIEPVIATIHA